MPDNATVRVCYVSPGRTNAPQDLEAIERTLAVSPIEYNRTSVDAVSGDCVVVGLGLSLAERCEFVADLWAGPFDGPCLVRVRPDEPSERAIEAGATDIVSGESVSATVLANRVENVVDRKRTKERERRQERRLESLLEHSVDRLSVLDEQGRYAFVSPAFKRLLGYDEEELLGTRGFEYVHPEDHEHVKERFDRLVTNREAEVSVEYRVRDADSNWRWVRSRWTNRLDDPSVEGVVVNSTDITDQRRRQQELEEERAFTESIFAALPDVFYAFDESGNFLRWNDRFNEVTGYSDGEITEMQPIDFIAPTDREQVIEAILRAFSGETVTVEANFLTKDEETTPYEFTGAEVSGPDEETIALVGIGRDISDRKRRQRRFEAVFNNTYQFTGLMEPDGTLLEANETALQFGGIDRGDVVGEKLWDAYWFQNSDRAREVARESVEEASQGRLYREEIEVQGGRSTEIIDFSVRPITDDDGTVTMLVPEGRTITALKQREQHLQVLHRFLRHNLRNKMTVIDGTTSILAEELSDPEYREHLDQISAASAELVELSETARELLDITIGTADDPHPMDPEPLVSRIITTFRENNPEATIELASEIDSLVKADWRLESVLEQLVENAVVHSNADSPIVEIGLTETADSVEFCISDNGPRIPDDELSVLLGGEKQSQLTHGTGFGLWLVRYVIDSYGGAVEHEYTADGNVVTIELEAVGDQPEPAEGQSEVGKP